MKKFLCLLLGLAVASSAMAGVNFKQVRTAERKSQPVQMVTKDVKVNRHQAGNYMMKAFVTPSLRAAITEQPEGEVKSYIRSGDAVYPGSSSIYHGEQSGRMDIVFADGGKVYMKNILYQMGTAYADSWVEGQLNADETEITVPMGQSIYYSDYYSADIVLAWGTTSIDGTSLVFTPDETVTEVVYAIDGDVITLQGGIAPVEDAENQYWNYCATGLGCYWTDDDSFGGALEWNTVLTFTDEPIFEPTIITEQPEGELVEYVRTGNSFLYNSTYGLYIDDQSGKAYIVYAPDGQTVYLKDPIYGLSIGSWVQGTVNGNKITVPTGQFLNWNSQYEYGLTLAWGSAEAVATSDTTSTIQHYYFDDVTEITYTIDGNTITLDNCVEEVDEDGNFVYCEGLSAVWNDDLSWQGFLDWNTVYTQHEVEAATPANPTADNWSDSGSENGYTYFAFTLPTVDTEGNDLDPEYVSYSIYTDDDEIFTFDAETYSYDLTEDMTEIPYSVYSNGYDFYKSKVYFYRTNTGNNPMFENRIGIQVHYTVNGVKNSSDIIYLEVTPPEPAEPAVPADPTDLSWYDSNAENGYTRLNFTLPTVDTEGNALDNDNLSYSIYTDYDQIFTFDAETYSYDLQYTGDLTDIPYWIYSDGYDFYTNKVYFYRTNAEGYEPFFTWRIGIQVHNTVDGVKNSSNIVYIEVFEEPQTGKLVDVNGDDVVDIEDVTALIAKVLGNNPDPFIEENANVDGLGGIDIEDVTVLISMVLGTNND